MKKNKITLTEVELLTKDMIPCFVKFPDTWNFIFLDIKNKTFCNCGFTTILWLKLREISMPEFREHCWKVFNILKEENIEYEFLSFFRSDSIKVKEFVKNFDIEDMCKTIFKEEKI